MSFKYALGISGVKQELPVPERQILEWIEKGELKQMKLGEHALKLLKEVLHTDMQCLDAILLMPELMANHVLDACK
jgi:hypothetical protein